MGRKLELPDLDASCLQIEDLAEASETVAFDIALVASAPSRARKSQAARKRRLIEPHYLTISKMRGVTESIGADAHNLLNGAARTACREPKPARAR